MHTENTVYIQGPKARIFQLAADIQNWPDLLPHYREVIVFVRWRSVQVCEPDTGRIYFKHLAGVAQGMWVVWTVEDDPWGRGVRVTIGHDLTYPFPFLNGWFARRLVGDKFVQAIAGRTLATIKATVEKEARL
jgi:hypothetical protein